MTYQDPHPEIPEQYARHLRATEVLCEQCGCTHGTAYELGRSDGRREMLEAAREIIQVRFKTANWIEERHGEATAYSDYVLANHMCVLAEQLKLFAARKERE